MSHHSPDVSGVDVAVAKQQTPLHYIASQQHPDQLPPPASTGVIGWFRENLFSSVSNSLLTVVSILFLIWVIPGFVDWAIVKSVWNAGSLSECRELVKAAHGEGASGACWAVINERFDQLMYGFYPAELRWRPNVAILLLFAAIVPVLFKTMRPLVYAMGAVIVGKSIFALYAAFAGIPFSFLSPTTYTAAVLAIGAAIMGGEDYRKRWVILTFLFPVIAYFLLWGGFVFEPVESKRFGGFLLTMVIGVTGIAFSLPLGVLLALGRRSNLPILQMICVTFIEFIRGVPLITLLFVASVLLNYLMPPGTDFDLILRVLIMVTLFASAYMAEVVRGGLAALPKGQYEAADTLGLKYWQGMRLIILPQALKISIPGIVNTFIGLFKDTTLVAIIALFDPVGLLNPIRADSNWNGIVWELYGFIALVFFICCFGMSQYSQFLERRLRAADRR
ncbi:MAG: amino acid ABC transporter permease [Pseudomonadota bacterium]